jgi:hypothetical protein
MKKVVSAFVAVLLMLAVVAPTFAAAPPAVPPKGTEGPDIRAKVPPKGIEGPDIRAFPPKTPWPPEGPDIR